MPRSIEVERNGIKTGPKPQECSLSPPEALEGTCKHKHDIE